MENTHEITNLIDTKEQDMKKNEIKQDELYEETNDELITEEELEHIHPYLDKKFPSPTMNLGIM